MADPPVFDIKKEMVRIGDIIEENKQNITSTQFNLIKTIFTIIPELKGLPYKIQNACANLMHVRKYKAEEIIIYSDDKHPEAFIIVEGTAYYSQSKEQIQPKKIISQSKKSKEENPKIYTPGKCLGDFHILTSHKWKIGTVFAMEDSKMICISMPAVERKLKDLEMNMQSQDIIHYLNNYIPSFQKMSRYRDRIISCFKPREFLAGSLICKEGEPCYATYMIREGEARIIRETSTLEAIAQENGLGKCVDTTLQTKRGYLSDSFAKFNLGQATPGQWIGDDFLVLESTNYAYSAIAQTKVSCLELPREEYETLPKEITRQFRKHILERRLWIRDRMKNVSSFVDKLMKTTNTVDFSESLAEKRQMFPLANIHAIDSIRKKEINLSLQKPITLQKTKQSSPSLIDYLATERSSQSTTMRSFFRLTENSPKAESNDTKCTQFSIYKHMSGCIPLSYASSTKPLNLMFPAISKQRLHSLSNKNVAQSSRSSVAEKSIVALPLKFQQKELNAFNIGKKTINLIYTKKEKPPTPNPYNLK